MVIHAADDLFAQFAFNAGPVMGASSPERPLQKPANPAVQGGGKAKPSVAAEPPRASRSAVAEEPKDHRTEDRCSDETGSLQAASRPAVGFFESFSLGTALPLEGSASAAAVSRQASVEDIDMDDPDAAEPVQEAAAELVHPVVARDLVANPELIPSPCRAASAVDQASAMDVSEAAASCESAEASDPFASFVFGGAAVVTTAAAPDLPWFNMKKGKLRAKGAKTEPPGKRMRSNAPPPTFKDECARPALQTDAAEQPLRFMLVDVGEDTSSPLQSDVWLHGTTVEGNSVSALIEGYRHYFFCSSPVVEDAFTDVALCRALTAQLEDVEWSDEKPPLTVTRLKRRSLMYYQPDEVEFLRVEVSNFKWLPAVRRMVEKGIRINAPEESGAKAVDFRSTTWEANVPALLHFMADTGLVGAGWVELPPDVYRVVEEGERRSAAQIEVVAPVSGVKVVAPEGDFLSPPPLRLMAFTARADEAGKIVCIACVLSILGEAEPIARMAWLLASKADEAPEGTALHYLPDEADVLEHFSAFVAHCDPDMLVCYDDGTAPLSRLLERAQASQAASTASQLGRLNGVLSKARRVNTMDTRLDVNAEGRLVIDVAHIVAQDHKLMSYALPAVCQHFLAGTHFEFRAVDAIAMLRSRPACLAQQDLRDAENVLKLCDKLCCVYNLCEMARVTGVPMDYLLTRGQMIKVTSQLLRKARQHGFILPGRSAAATDALEGGFVMDPKTGLYDEPIVVLDFASLYPSIMMAHNLCYTTLLPEGGDKALSLDSSCVTEAPASMQSGVSYKFVKTTKRRGILPEILDELLSARKHAKNAMKQTDDPRMRAVLNGRQLALKVSANSVYGFTGSTAGSLPSIEIASSVTAYGRSMITSTAAFIDSECSGAHVVYGDTDSVMVSFGNVPRSEAVRLGGACAAAASDRFEKPICLQFEKVLQPFLLMNKKRYAGRLWEGDRQQGLDMKGIETVRRDWCGLVRQLCDESLDLLLRPERSVDVAIDHVRKTVNALRKGEVDMRHLVISKTLGKKGEADYVAKAAHVELAEKLKKRDPKTAPRPGERVAYVIVSGASGAKLYERAEDPQYAQEEALPLDADYYIDQQLKMPLLRIFEPVVQMEAAKLASSLLGGNIGRRTAMPSAKGGLGMFVRRVEKCLACRVAVGSKEPFCKTCAGTDRAKTVAEQKQADGRLLRARQEVLTAACASCVVPGMCKDDVRKCANVSCDIFFERSQVDKSVEEACSALARLELEW
eukprot:TRINITY_DN5018_c0_g1_i1.p1 TRINITY_DN5018_c0_g1~~TRINITY_DN5018_c0_g1_i1.p1  ORF type:complete len:1249 (+),score=246.01 TRINITY_DN5018_c0_g1_i1:91-3837(+)